MSLFWRVACVLCVLAALFFVLNGVYVQYRWVVWGLSPTPADLTLGVAWAYYFAAVAAAANAIVILKLPSTNGASTEPS